MPPTVILMVKKYIVTVDARYNTLPLHLQTAMPSLSFLLSTRCWKGVDNLYVIILIGVRESKKFKSLRWSNRQSNTCRSTLSLIYLYVQYSCELYMPEHIAPYRILCTQSCSPHPPPKKTPKNKRCFLHDNLLNMPQPCTPRCSGNFRFGPKVVDNKFSSFHHWWIQNIWFYTLQHVLYTLNVQFNL